MRIAPIDDAEVELSLLSPRAREESESSSETLVHDELDVDEESVKPVLKTRPATWKEKKNMVLLTCLFLSQGVPLGLAIDYLYILTAVFTFLITAVATQGWALTLLSEHYRLSTGSLLSYTGFLALNSETFAAKHGIPRLTLGAYCMFCAMLSYALTLWLLFEKENDVEEEGDMSLKAIYYKMWEIMKFRHVQTLLVLLLVAKIGFQADSAVSTLKMVEKGFSKEDLSLTVLISFPFQIWGGLLAGRWSKGERPLRAWMHAYWPAFALVLLSTLTVYWFPHPPLPLGWYVFIIAQSIVSSLVMTVQFGGMTAFHTRISDPVAGGTYMTLFATFNNLGLLWPRYFVLKGVDLFTYATCSVSAPSSTLEPTTPASCVTKGEKAACTALGGTCDIQQDGYYVISAICLGVGIILLIFFMIPTARRLQSIPPKEWRVRSI
ncbi:acetyl-coenzyme A transporter 1-domain-containing protein [Fomitopsis serialis]|uniref:acetyl-coenzyme A transporter 1-domain-containing protein n=1 Tax=Fomitopsis serialis TaxID=139415 RepID=UPI002008A359|nr:acetyl-coenzyme A transporter 1-domain-containing protein [Neoantrodia serialis]KAH9935789.1 acetyl-coenzyme A transporter 1-domain-containing protein [Neoantrodia serialis]